MKDEENNRMRNFLLMRRKELTSKISNRIRHAVDTLDEGVEEEEAERVTYRFFPAHFPKEVQDEFEGHLIGPEREELAEVEAALERLREGRYGICDNCAAEIAYSQLLLSPERRLCEACASAAARAAS